MSWVLMPDGAPAPICRSFGSPCIFWVERRERRAMVICFPFAHRCPARASPVSVGGWSQERRTRRKEGAFIGEPPPSLHFVSSAHRTESLRHARRRVGDWLASTRRRSDGRGAHPRSGAGRDGR